MACISRFLSRFWLGLATLAVASPAFAEELLMPFSCSATGGSVRLRPTDETLGYRIYGARERHVYSVCAPDNPNRCRNWMIHRFDVDCGGARVAWLDIVEAASRFGRNRAWVEDGQMHLSVGLGWSADRGERPRRRLWRESGVDELETISLPAGFAPTLGLPVQFVAGGSGRVDHGDGPGTRADGTWDAPASDALPPEERMAEQGAAPWNATPRAPQKSDKSAALAPGAVSPAKDKTGAARAGDGPEKAPTAPPAGAAKPAPSASAKNPVTKDPATKDGEALKLPDGVVLPTIINGSNAVPTTRAAEPSAAVPAASGTETGSPPAAPAASTPAPAGQSDVASANQSTDATTSTLDVSLGEDRPAAGPLAEPRLLWAGAAAAALLAMVAFYLVSRRRDGAQDNLHGRDFGAVTFDAPPAGNTSLVAVAPAPTPAVAPDPGPQTVVATERPGNAGIPTTLAEAFAVLGTNADAPTEVIKKIVNGLRQSWHSDFARSDEDRVQRERRMQQVNAAWELIIQSRRAAA